MSFSEQFCRFCSSQEVTELYETNSVHNVSYTLVKCLSCAAISLTPAPSEAELIKAYAEDYYGERQSKFSPFIEKILDFFRSSRARRMHDMLPSGKVLDIGCGNGLFLKQLEALGNYSVFGTEMPGGSAERARLLLEPNLEIGELNERTFYNHTFDGIVLNHVFEHLTQPSFTLDWITERIEKNGVVCLALPNIESWQSTFFKGHWLHLDPPRHLIYFSHDELCNQMKMRGFEYVETRFFNLEYNPFGAVQSWFNWMGFKRELLYESLKGNKKYTKKYTVTVALQRVLYPILMGLFIPVDGVAAFFKKSATMEVYFRKVS